MTIDFDDGGRPDINSVDRSLRNLEQEPGASAVQGLDARAMINHRRQEVRLVAGRANLIVSVTYSAVDLNGTGETPLSNDQLDAVARHVAQEVLAKAGQPQ